MSAWEDIQKGALKAQIAMDLEGPALRTLRLLLESH